MYTYLYVVSIRTIARPAAPCCRHRTVLTVRDAPHVAAHSGPLSIRAAPSAHRTKLWARLPPAPSHSDAALPAGPAPPRACSVTSTATVCSNATSPTTCSLGKPPAGSASMPRSTSRPVNFVGAIVKRGGAVKVATAGGICPRAITRVACSLVQAFSSSTTLENHGGERTLQGLGSQELTGA